MQELSCNSQWGQAERWAGDWPRESLRVSGRVCSAHFFLPSPLQLARGVNSGQGLGIEIIATLQLVLCVLATTDRRRRDLGGSGPLAIGLSVALGHLLAVSRAPGCGVGVEKVDTRVLALRGNWSDRCVPSHLPQIDYTGCGINPARSFGSSVITHNFSNHWVRPPGAVV